MAQKYLKDMPELVKEYDFDKNKDLDFEKLTYGSKQKVWWGCVKGHQWITTPNARTSQNQGCPYCAGKKVCWDNCLEKLNPEVLSEWDYSKNKLTPKEYTPGSNKKVWWKCSICKNSYKNTIHNKTFIKQGCPYCSNKKVNKTNCILATHPELAKEWDFDKNIINVEKISYGNKTKVWWKCEKGHSWKSTANDRSSGYGCPICKESKGEKIVYNILDELNVLYEREYKFSELGHKRFDFALFKNKEENPWGVIEYHGRQHYEPVRFSYKMTDKQCKDNLALLKKNDKIKKNYCIDNNIKYLEIPYKQMNNAEKLIKDFLS